LRTDDLKHKGHARAGRLLGIGRDTVRKIRQEYGIIMDKVERPCANGVHLIAVSEFRKKKSAPKLTQSQSELVAEAYPVAQQLAKKLANGILSEEDLLTIAHDAIINAARYWKPNKIGKKLSWKSYSYGGVKLAFRRSFARKRKELVKAGVFCVNDAYSSFLLNTLSSVNPDEEPKTMAEKFHSMRGPGRFVIEWLTGLHGRSAKKPEEIQKFLGNSASVELVQQYVQEAKQALAG
jgi:hypothetical protein